MSATTQRDKVCALVKSSSKEALGQARLIGDPWFRAQALAWVSRFSESGAEVIAREAALASDECDDDYKKSAVRSWEIAALAERDFSAEARKSLYIAVAIATKIQPASSRSEALFLLLNAAAKLSSNDTLQVFEALKTSCSGDEHWRCKRAIRNGQKIVNGEMSSRPFFW